MAKQKIKRENMGVIREVSMKFLEEYLETGSEEAYRYYNGLQGVVEDAVGDDYFRPYYKPIKRKDFIFSPKFKSLDKLLNHGFTESYGSYTKFIKLYESLEIYIKIPNGFEFKNDMSEIDVYDYITVMDDDFGQPYMPFYEMYNKEVTDFPVLQLVIQRYNNKMLGMGGVFKEAKEDLNV